MDIIWLLVVPLGVSLFAVAAAMRMSAARSAVQGDDSGPAACCGLVAGSGARLVAVGGWWLATALAVQGRQGWAVWPEEAWRQTIWAILLFGVVLAWRMPGLTSGAVVRGPDGSPGEFGSGRWPLAGVAAVLVAYLTMPTGDGWDDVLPLHHRWMAAMVSACLVNVWAIERLILRGGGRWVLWVLVAGIAAPTIDAAATYGGLAEWGGSALIATGAFAVVASLGRGFALAVAFPAVATAAALAASTRFYSFEGHPGWLYALILFLPAIVAAADRPLAGRSAGLRVGIAGLLAALLLGVIAATLFLGEPDDQW